MLEFGIGLGWLGWEWQNYLWTARAAAGTAPVTPGQLQGGRGAAAAHLAHLGALQSCCCASRLPKLGEKSCKKSFSARGSGSLPSPGPGAFGVSLLRVWTLLLGLRGGFWPGWAGERLPKPLEPPELLPAFKTSGFARSSSTGAFPLPFPRLPSVSAGFLVQPLVQFRVTSGCF